MVGIFDGQSCINLPLSPVGEEGLPFPLPLTFFFGKNRPLRTPAFAGDVSIPAGQSPSPLLNESPRELKEIYFS